MTTRAEFEATRPESVDLPAPTAWPFVLAAGLALMTAGLVTTLAVTAVGAVLFIAAAVGWFREVLPHERHETVPVAPIPEFPSSLRQSVARLDVGAATRHRARLPIEIHPISAGVKGGLAGSVAMAALAGLYGLLKQGSLWYPINLLAAGASARLAAMPVEALREFHASGLLIGIAIHGLTSLMVGLLYGAMLPIFPRRPILLGGVVGPLLWTGLIRATLEVVNPTLNDRIDWKWFVASQIAFGIVAGIVVTRTARVRTMQFEPFAVRAGIHAQDSEEPPPESGGDRP